MAERIEEKLARYMMLHDSLNDDWYYNCRIISPEGWETCKKYEIMATEILALIKEAGWKSPEEIFDQTMEAKKSGWDDCLKWYKANGYVRLAEDQRLPPTPLPVNVYATHESPSDPWYWQGDGEDHLESLACPVLIEADDLRNLINEAEKAGMRKVVEQVKPIVDKLFEALSHADFSNGIVAFGIDEGQVRASEFIKNIENEWQSQLRLWFKDEPEALKEWGIE